MRCGMNKPTRFLCFSRPYALPYGCASIRPLRRDRKGVRYSPVDRIPALSVLFVACLLAGCGRTGKSRRRSAISAFPVNGFAEVPRIGHDRRTVCTPNLPFPRRAISWCIYGRRRRRSARGTGFWRSRSTASRSRSTIPARPGSERPLTGQQRSYDARGILDGGKPDSAVVALTAVNAPLDYVCPMDPDVRSATPGVCPRCGMKLVMGIPDPEEYPLHLADVAGPVFGREKKSSWCSASKIRTPGKRLAILRPCMSGCFIFSLSVAICSISFTIIPNTTAQASFAMRPSFPKPGMYRILGDFYPAGCNASIGSQDHLCSGRAVVAGGRETHSGSRIRRRARTSAVELTHGSAAARPPVRSYAALLPPEARRRPGKISRRVGAHAGRQRRPDRSASRASVQRR